MMTANVLDICDFGAKADYITKENKVCGCKICNTFELYVRKIRKEAISFDYFNSIIKKMSITCGARKYNAINVVLLTDTVACYLPDQQFAEKQLIL